MNTTKQALAEIGDLLADYEKQFSQMQLLETAELPASGVDHPYPFFSVYKDVHDLYSSTRHSTCRLQETLGELRKTTNSQEMQIQALASDLDSKTRQIAYVEDEFVKHKSEYRVDRDHLQKDCGEKTKLLSVEVDKCKGLQDKLKRLVMATQNLMIMKEDEDLVL